MLRCVLRRFTMILEEILKRFVKRFLVERRLIYVGATGVDDAARGIGSSAVPHVALVDDGYIWERRHPLCSNGPCSCTPAKPCGLCCLDPAMLGAVRPSTAVHSKKQQQGDALSLGFEVCCFTRRQWVSQTAPTCVP